MLSALSCFYKNQYVFWRTSNRPHGLSFFCSLEPYWFYICEFYTSQIAMKRIKTVKDIKLQEQKLEFKFQEELTKKLDSYDSDFDQNILNEIVLWKVNRYALFDDETIKLLNTIKYSSINLDIDITKKVLSQLLSTKGVKLAMASTILRFKNPQIYQIIDQRVYRVIYWEDMPRVIKIEEAIEFYLGYLTKLKKVCSIYKIDFYESDRVLYALDKEINSSVKIKY